MAVILAIDPGTTESAWVLYDHEKRAVLDHRKGENSELVSWLRAEWVPYFDLAAIEMVACYGKPVGHEVFETVIFIGWLTHELKGARLIYRKDVKLHLCCTVSGVTDAVIRQRLIDLWGGKEKAIGKKAGPGPLYGLHGDEWQALALALTAAET